MNPLHYPSLELCKKLTQVGFPTTDNLFAFDRNPDDVTLTSYEEVEEWSFYRLLAHCPSVMEMLDVIPKSLNMKYECWDGEEVEANFQMSHSRAGYYFTDWGEHHETVGIVEDTLPNALAGMILWLVENKHLSFNK